MSKAESENGRGQDFFSLDGKLIGGPKEFWKRITHDEIPVRGAWEFTNQRGQEDQLEGHNFHFPRGSRVDIYIEKSGEERIFTAMGGRGASINSHWKVIEIQLYLNSRKWEEQHEGQWTEWENVGSKFRPTSEWYPVGTTPPKKIEPPPTPAPKAPAYTPVDRDKRNAKRALKWVAAGLLAWVGIGTINEIAKSQDIPESYVPPLVTSEITPSPELTYDSYDLKFGESYTVPGNSTVIIPAGSGIVVGPPAAFQNVEIDLTNDQSKKIYSDFIAIYVDSDRSMQISSAKSPEFYQAHVEIYFNMPGYTDMTYFNKIFYKRLGRNPDWLNTTFKKSTQGEWGLDNHLCGGTGAVGPVSNTNIICRISK